MIFKTALLLAFVFCPMMPRERQSSYPYIAGDTFRASCDFICDEYKNTIVPAKVKYGATIFLRTDDLEHFFSNIHPKIANPYILVSHNSDASAPRNFAHMLEDTKLLAWFAQNVDAAHPKLHPIPIGLANRFWPHGSIEIVAEVQSLPAQDRTILLYMNFSPETCLSERTHVFELFHNKPFCTAPGHRPFKDYLIDLMHTKFVLSPRGYGIDCHRTWEALLMGAVPIVKSSTLDPLYEGLPVVIVQDWNEITEEFLNKKWEEIQQSHFQRERMYADYWLKRIFSFK